MELWDAYDAEGRPLGTLLERGGEVPPGQYHKVVSVVVRHRSDGSFLLTRRDPRKPTFPDVFEVSAGGAVQRGEDPSSAIRRELREETGIETGDFTPLYAEKGPHTLFYGFLCVTDWPKEKITLQEGETVDFRWLLPEELQALRDAEPDLVFVQRHARAYVAACNEALWPEAVFSPAIPAEKETD